MSNGRYKWKRIYWWQDILGGWLFIDLKTGEALEHVYKNGAVWRAYVIGCGGLKDFVSIRQAKAWVEECYDKKIDADLEQQFREWERMNRA